MRNLLACAAIVAGMALPLKAQDALEAGCATPGSSDVPTLGVLPKEFGDPASLAELNDDILRHHQAELKQYAAAAGILNAMRGDGCGEIDDAFERWTTAVDAAFAKRVKEDSDLYGAGQVRWEPAKDPERRLAPRRAEGSADALGLSGACRLPAPPGRTRVPLVPKDAPAFEKVVLTRLASDAASFNEALAGQYAAFGAELPLERAFDCREVLVGYARLVSVERIAFQRRQDRALASIVEPSLQWEASGPR